MPAPPRPRPNGGEFIAFIAIRRAGMSQRSWGFRYHRTPLLLRDPLSGDNQGSWVMSGLFQTQTAVILLVRRYGGCVTRGWLVGSVCGAQVLVASLAAVRSNDVAGVFWAGSG